MTIRSVSDRETRDSSFAFTNSPTPFPRSPSFPPIRPSFISRFLSWLHNNQIVAAALILLLTVTIYCFATRYSPHPHLAISIDRWTGNILDPYHIVSD